MKTFSPDTFRTCFPGIASDTVFLDSAATALKPDAMSQATHHYYQHNSGATVHRSHHQQAQTATEQFEQARDAVCRLINADDARRCIWTKGTTESINLVTQGYFRPRLQPGDEIIVSELEHHSNLIPWIILAQQTGATLVKWPLTEDRTLCYAQLQTLLTPQTRVVAVTQMSNVTGFQPDIDRTARLAHQHGALIVVDGAQGVVHHPCDVTQSDIDFYAFSAHKIYGPNGLGVLYGRGKLLDAMQPWQGGGKMLTDTDFFSFTPAPVPARFEAGTPNVAGVIAFGATLRWLETCDLRAAHHHTIALCDSAEQQLAALPGFRSYRAPGSPLLAFNFDNIHHSDIATLLAEKGIALRHGQHCAQPLCQALNTDGCLRVSFMPYNQSNDIDKLLQAIRFALDILAE
ncbi:cysteine desulfurase CsdA [Morganella psychrotolerans]|uniref:cysteine desulfurase CsdA n=1 Tax=Morganella psychrotolerans TaxID=368603 RepID=UPI0039AF745A